MIHIQIVELGDTRRKYARKAPRQNDPSYGVGYGRVVTLTPIEWSKIRRHQEKDEEMQKMLSEDFGYKPTKKE